MASVEACYSGDGTAGSGGQDMGLSAAARVAPHADNTAS